jgi:hypothetical protein
MTGGTYGQSGPCTPTFIQGTAYLDNLNSQSTQAPSASFSNGPLSGDTLIVGCGGVDQVGYTVTDNQSNTYSQVVAASEGMETYAPVAIFASKQIQTFAIGSGGAFTVTCTLPAGQSDNINVFAVEYSGLSTNATDATATNSGFMPVDSPPQPMYCGTLNTTETNDLVIALYNGASEDAPAGLSSVPGYRILACNGAPSGYCLADNGDLYEVGALTGGVASTTGSYLPGFNANVVENTGVPWACATAAFAAIGQQ